MPRSDAAGTTPVSRRLLLVLLALAVVTPFVVVPDFLYPFVVPRAAWFRVLVAAAAAVLAWRWARGARGTATIAWRRERVGLALAAYAACVVVAAALGADPRQGLLGGMVRMGGAVAWVHYLLFFLLLRLVLDEGRWLPFLRLAALVGAAVTGWALLEAHGSGWFGIALFGWNAGRVVGPLGLAGPLAAYLLLSAAVAGFLATRAEGRVARVGWGLVAAAELWVVLLTGTRAALVGAAAAALALGAWAVAARGRSSRARRLAVGGLAAVAAVAVGIALLGERAFPGLERLLDLGPDALASRLPLWRAAWEGFLEHPLLGIGPEGFGLAFDASFRPGDYLAADAAHHDRAHSVLMGTLVETGAVGAVAYLGFWTAAFGAALWALGRSDREPALIWLVGGVLAYFVYLLLWFEDLSSFHLLLVVVAFLEHRRLGAAAPDDGGSRSAPPDRGGGGAAEAAPAAPKRALAVGAAALLLAGVGWYHAQVLGASRDTWTAMSAREPTAPFQHLDRALARPLVGEERIVDRYVVALEGLAGLVRRGEARVEPDRVARAFRRGERAVRREMDRRPAYSVVHARMAGLQGARWRWSGDAADFRRAVDGYRRALEISPGRVRYLHEVARLHSQRGDPERAMEVLDEALRRLPGWWATYNTMAQVQWDAGRRERAVAFLLRAAGTDVRRKNNGTGSQFMIRAGSWLEARGTPTEAARLYEAYLATRYPGWGDGPGARIGSVPEAALPIAARLPITLLHAGRPDAARRAADRLRARLPAHLRRPAVTDRLDRFLGDVAADRTERWREEWGVLPTDVPLGGGQVP